MGKPETLDLRDAKSLQPQHGLKRQLIFRFALVFLFAALLGGISTLIGYRMIANQSHRNIADDTAKHIVKQFGQTTLSWENYAFRLKSQIDFMRLLAGGDPKRWLKLHAYLTAQEGGVRNFDTLLILRRDNSVAFTSGPEGEELGRSPARLLKRKWYLSPDHDLHLIIRLPIWLGNDGQGTLVLMRPLENATLISLAPPDVELFLLAENGSVLNSTRDTLSRAEIINPYFSGGARPNNLPPIEQRMIPLGDDDHLPVRLIMHQHFTEPLSSSDIVAGAVMLLTLLTLMLWLVLGQWVQQIAQRIGLLYQSTRRFAEKHTVDDIVTHLLESPLSGTDEISEVSAACQGMMHSVEQHQE